MAGSWSKKLLMLVLPVLACSLVGFTLSAQAANVQKGATVVNEITHDVSLPLRDMAKMVPVRQGKPHEIEMHGRPFIKQVGNGQDGAAQTITLPEVSTIAGLNFDGQPTGSGADDVAPPDTEGAIGATQYVQWVNLEYNVYDKTTGSLVLGPIQGNAPWAGFTNHQCANNNSGDPIVLYDKAAQRWVFAQNVFSTPYTICIAVSTTSDATGTYNRYAFPVLPNSSTSFPDYPKWGVWSDAYYETYNVFANGISQAGSEVCAADRTNMLAGNAATIQCFNSGNQYFSLLPSDIDGNTAPPAGSPNYIISLGTTTTTLDLWQFHVDFVTPANSTFTGPTALTVPAYTLVCSSGTNRSCIPQPSPGEHVDSLGGRLMYRNAYRNFGDHEALVVSHTVKPPAGSTAVGSVRWYEIRTPMTPTLFQSGTFANAKVSFWMPSIAMDKVGDIALGFSASATILDPSVLYTGRVPSDPVGTMESPKIVIKGTGVQESTANRWGDYSAMQVDPTDDCTFWYTQEYIKSTGSFHWATRINSFKFNTCR